MPTAYRLAADKVEQAQAILASELWYDQQVTELLGALSARLGELDRKVLDVSDSPVAAEPTIRDRTVVGLSTALATRRQVR